MIEEKIKEKFNIKNLKLIDAVLKKEDKVCYLSFLVDCVLDEQTKTGINKFCEEFLNSKVRASFKRAIFDSEAVIYIVRNLLKEKYPNIFQMLDANDISLCEKNEEIVINIKVFDEMKGLAEKNGLKSSIINKLSNCYFEKFNVELLEKKINNLEIIIDEMERGRETARLEKKQAEPIRVKVDEISLLIGEEIHEVPIALSFVKKPTDEVCVAGKVCFFNKKTFKKKQKNGEIEEKPFYTFMLDDSTAKINCTFFPTKQTLPKMEKIVNGTNLVCTGSVELFNEKLSFRPKNISLCVSFEPIQKKIEYLGVPEKYNTVLPLQFANSKQLNLLGEDVSKTTESEYLKNNKVVVFDLETTGLYFDRDEIIEIGACKIEDGVITQTFETLIKPNILIPEEATKVNNITNEMVANSPCFEEVVGDFYKFCEGCVLVAYNAGFDKGFIDYYGEKCRYKFGHKVVDAMIVAKEQLKGLKNYKLKTVLEKLQIVNEGAHRAVHDAIATAKAFIVLAEKL